VIGCAVAPGERLLVFPHRKRSERAVLESGPQVVREPGRPNPLLDLDDRQTIDAGSAGTLVSCDRANAMVSVAGSCTRLKAR
ncbi:hypothetical protein, partial [Streptomyces formicae]